MIALDTNIVVRLITDDDPDQVRRARALILKRSGFVQLTVILETEWVLRSAYRFSRKQIAEALTVLSQTKDIAIESPTHFVAILRAYEAGLDFADAMHLACCDDAEAFATFDGPLKAGAARSFPERTVLIP